MAERADSERLLGMLWRRVHPAERPSVGRRPTLTVDAVVDAAMGVADTDGLTALSMSRVGKALGVGTMSLYTYVRSKAELVDLMVDEAATERALPRPGEERPADWRAQVELFAQRTHEMYQRHPWLHEAASTRQPLGPGLLDGSEFLLAALSGAGLRPPDAASAAAAVTAFVSATAYAEVDSSRQERESGESTGDWWQARWDGTVFSENYYDPERFPTMVATYLGGGYAGDFAEQARRTRDFGLRRLLDGIQAML